MFPGFLGFFLIHHKTWKGARKQGRGRAGSGGVQRADDLRGIPRAESLCVTRVEQPQEDMV